MRYYKNGFYSEQSPENDRYEISDEYFTEIFKKQCEPFFRIVEDENGFPIIQKIEETEEQKLRNLRKLREVECFTVINRGEIWYSSLDEEKINELKNWYNLWLDVTITYQIPDKPSWLK